MPLKGAPGNGSSILSCKDPRQGCVWGGALVFKNPQQGRRESQAFPRSWSLPQDQESRPVMSDTSWIQDRLSTPYLAHTSLPHWLSEHRGIHVKFCPPPRHFPLSPDDFWAHIINRLVKYCLKITFMIGLSIYRFNGSLTVANPSKLFIDRRFSPQCAYGRAIPITAIICRTSCGPGTAPSNSQAFHSVSWQL